MGEPLSKADIKDLAKFHATHERCVRKLLDLGVVPNDIDEVLEVKGKLSVTWKTGRSGPKIIDEDGYYHRQLIEKQWHDTVRISTLAAAYNKVGKDVQMLGLLAEYAEELIDRNGLGKFTWALETAIDHYKESGPRIFE